MFMDSDGNLKTTSSQDVSRFYLKLQEYFMYFWKQIQFT